MMPSETAAKKATIHYIKSGYETIARNEYRVRQNAAVKVVHQALATIYKLTENTNPEYKYTPTLVLIHTQYKIYWDI